jgi:hypothetical protein
VNAHLRDQAVRLARRRQAEVRRLQRSTCELKVQLARREATTLVQNLKAEGIDFGGPEGEAEEAGRLAALAVSRSDRARDHHVDQVIRKCYRRLPGKPSRPAADPNAPSPDQVKLARRLAAHRPELYRRFNGDGQAVFAHALAEVRKATPPAPPLVRTPAGFGRCLAHAVTARR